MKSLSRGIPSCKALSCSVLSFGLLLFGLAALSSLHFPAAAVSAQTPAATPPDMVFYVAKGGQNACGHGCDQWIVADGTFDAGAAQRLRHLLRKLAGAKLPVFFYSPGGHAIGAMELGRLLRNEKLVAGVGRTTPSGCDRDKLYDDACKALKHDGVAAELDETAAQCHSACVWALAGAAERRVPPSARVGIHAAEIRPRVPVPAAVIAAAKVRSDRRIAEYLHEMGMDRALFAAANATPHQSLRLLQRDEIIRFGLDRRGFGETSWRYLDKPRPAMSKAWFARTGHQQPPGPQTRESQGLPYRNAFVRMDCGDAASMRLTVALEMAQDEAEVDPSPFMISVNGVRAESTWNSAFPIKSDPTRFDLRTTKLAVDRIAQVDDSGSIEIVASIPNSAPYSTVTLAMNGFSEAYAKLHKACDATRSVNASCPGGGTPPHCLILSPPGLTTRPSPSLMTQPWNH